MGQGASASGQNSQWRQGRSSERHAKHRRSTRSLPDAAVIRTTPANCQNVSRPSGAADSAKATPQVNSSLVACQQQQMRRAGVATSVSMECAQNVTFSGSHVAVSGGQSTDSCKRDQEAIMKKYMHRDAAPYYVSTKARPPGAPVGPRSFDISLSRPWAENVSRYQKATSKSRYDEASPSSNWSDVASDMFRKSKHRAVDATNADLSNSDVQSDFVPAVTRDRHVNRYNRGSSRRCQQQKKSHRSTKHGQVHNEHIESEIEHRRRGGGEPDGETANGRLHYRDCGALAMTPVPENPYKEHQEYRQQKEENHAECRNENGGGHTGARRSKSVHDCASTKRSQLQPPSHPPPRPPKGKLHYYARLENDSSVSGTSTLQKRGVTLEQWIDLLPGPQYSSSTVGVEASQDRSASTDTPTPRSPGSSECDKLVIQSLRAELSAERALRVDAERRCKNHDKEVETNRQRLRLLETDVQRLTNGLDEEKRDREEEATLSKKKIDELMEKCRQLAEDLRRSVEEKHQAEIRCSQEKSSYEEYMDNVANQVGHALARQQTMKTECARLQKRVLEVEWENKVLKAQLRLTPVWSNSPGPNQASYFSLTSTTPTLTSKSAALIPTKHNFTSLASSSDSDHAHTNGTHSGVVYRRKSFREKMVGLHKYRQSMGSDPTLDQSGGANNTDTTAFSIESLASFSEENGFPPYGDPAVGHDVRFPHRSSNRQPYPQGSSYLVMMNAGEGMCSRPASLSYDAANLPQANGASQPPYRHVPNGITSNATPSCVSGSFANTYSCNISEELEDDDEPVKNYAAMSGEGGFRFTLPPAASLISTRPLPAFAATGSLPFAAVNAAGTADGSGNEQTATIGRNESTNNDSSTETLNAESNSRDGATLYVDSPKRKLDVMVNILTSVEVSNQSNPSFWSTKRGSSGNRLTTKTNQWFGHSNMGLLRDDGYSTMSSELYAVFDNSLQTGSKRSGIPTRFCTDLDTVKRQDRVPSRRPNVIMRSMSDGQLNKRHRLERRILRSKERSLNFVLCNSEDGDEMDCELEYLSNREALCDADVDIYVPSVYLEYAGLGDKATNSEHSRMASDGSADVPSTDYFPPDPSLVRLAAKSETRSYNRLDQTAPVSQNERTHLNVRRNASRCAANRFARSSNSDSSTTDGGEDDDDDDRAVATPRRTRRQTATVANASTSSTSTSFTSDDEDGGRVHIDEGAKVTMRLWLKQLKIKRAGQKSGLVRYVPPACRPSVLRAGVFARFGAEERRALAYFDFLHQFEKPEEFDNKPKSRSISDLYENLPYHERTGTVTSTSETYRSRSRCSSRASLKGYGSVSTLNSVHGGEKGMTRIRSYCSSLFLSDFCNDDNHSCSSSSSNSSLSFTF